ncbi:hypothetical protein [Nocardia sp. BMG111209]|uniref:hypothetical protein n=1 Tax=Nocardia sp. BMG111209 TaxID=1160137 RepID=UPI00035DC885|nr:hypothetical protein [Nocardia sp. BMG111209]
MTTRVPSRQWVFAALALVLVSVSAAGCGAAPDPSHSQPNGPGQLIGAEHLRTYSADEVRTELTGNGFDPGTTRFGVDTYRLRYRTTDPGGHETTATGLLALPRTADHELSTVAYEHGTQATAAEAPSTAADGGDVAAVLTYASAGFASAATDYLGLGLGPGPHPYLDVPSETTATVDMLRAARSEAAALNRQLREQVYITGFSQGGPAAMSVARALQDGSGTGWRAAAVAAISGPFALRTAEIPAVFDRTLDPASSGFYAAYLLVSWNRLHQLYRSPSEVFQPPYDGTMEQLLDGSHTDDELHRGFPDGFDRLLTPHAVDMLQHPTGSLADALRVADGTCSGWTPHLPIRLYIGEKDTDVATADSAQCRAAFGQLGVDTPIVDLGPLDHSGSGVAGTAQAVRWFTELDTTQ